jgi:ubiquinone/menaquinone biosynthesis C-methylase UbiE
MQDRPEVQRQREYDRAFRGHGLGPMVLRWALGTAGQWAVNTPLMRLPEHFNLRRDQRWLDVACGRGSLLRWGSARVGFDHAPVGIDYSRAALRLARRDSAHDRTPPAFAQATATALPFADASFDLVTCGYMVKHLTDSELAAFLEEVRRVLTGGGLALLWEYAPTGDAGLDAWNKRLLGAEVSEPLLRSTRTLLRAAEAAGYELARDARLRPFLLPPIPRASVLIGKAPAGWERGE